MWDGGHQYDPQIEKKILSIRKKIMMVYVQNFCPVLALGMASILWIQWIFYNLETVTNFNVFFSREMSPAAF